MKTITTNIYLFHELNEKAQRKAWEKSNFDFSEDCADEYLATLKVFESIFDIKCKSGFMGENNHGKGRRLG